MPIAPVRYTANQFGVPGVAGLNDQFGIWATNNSGAPLGHGDVVVYDNTVTVDANKTDVNGAATLTQASQTLTVDDTTGFAAAGNLLIMATLVTGGTAVPVFATYTAVGSGTTFTGVTAQFASIANGVADEAAVTVPPTPPTGSQVFNYPVVAGMAAAPGDGGRYVRLSGLSKDALVAGVVSLDGTAGTVTNGQMGTGYALLPNYGVSAHQPVIPPGGDVFVVTNGVARVYVAGLTVAALGILAVATIPGAVDDTPATIGNMVGIALEANTAKDANNTIRAKIALG